MVLGRSLCAVRVAGDDFVTPDKVWARRHHVGRCTAASVSNSVTKLPLHPVGRHRGADSMGEAGVLFTRRVCSPRIGVARSFQGASERQQSGFVVHLTADHDADRQLGTPRVGGGSRAGSSTPPTCVVCSGKLIAGRPVIFHRLVHGVKRHCASKSADGSLSLRKAPTGRGG